MEKNEHHKMSENALARDRRQREPEWNICRHCRYIWVENKWYEDKNFNRWRRTCCKTIPVARTEMKVWTDELKKISKYERYRIALLKEFIAHTVIVCEKRHGDP